MTDEIRRASERISRWIVQVSARAGFRLTEDHRITIVSPEESSAELVGVRIRNGVVWSTDDKSPGAPTFVGSSVIEAVGDFNNVSAAVSRLGNIASPYFQALATIANAGVEESEDLVAYSPPTDSSSNGAFLVQRHSEPRSPAARLRKVDASDVLEALGLLDQSPRREGIYRAMAHYRQAIGHLDPQNRVLSAQSLWLVVENLTHVVMDRLREEHDLPPGKPSKHDLAIRLGYRPKQLDADPPLVKLLLRTGMLNPSQIRRDNSHLTKFDSYIRKDIILGGDAQAYKHLNEMSNGFEHGYKSFDGIRTLSKTADGAFALIRRAILVEVGLRESSPLFDKRFDSPQGIWRPAFQGQGVYTDQEGGNLEVTRETFNADWPSVPGLSLVPQLQKVIDNPDGSRQLVLTVNAAAEGEPTKQTMTLEQADWVAPAGADTERFEQRSTITLNGQVIEETVQVPETAAGRPEARGTDAR